MADNKEYLVLPEEDGTIHISEDVIAAIAVGAVREVEGVSGMMTNLGGSVTDLVNNKKNAQKGTKGVKIDMSGYALKSDIVGLYEVKGSVDTYAALPTNPEKGDVYNVVNADASKGVRAGDNFVWTGSEWDNLGGVFQIDVATTSEIEALFA